MQRKNIQSGAVLGKWVVWLSEHRNTQLSIFQLFRLRRTPESALESKEPSPPNKCSDSASTFPPTEPFVLTSVLS